MSLLLQNQSDRSPEAFILVLPRWLYPVPDPKLQDREDTNPLPSAPGKGIIPNRHEFRAANSSRKECGREVLFLSVHVLL